MERVSSDSESGDGPKYAAKSPKKEETGNLDKGCETEETGARRADIIGMLDLLWGGPARPPLGPQINALDNQAAI